MHQAKETPIYNLKAVVQETGLKPDTLRAWERRYGLPSPQRTPSGHRLYTQRDIDILKWLMERQEEGLTISRAVALWHELEKEGEDPLHPRPAQEPMVELAGEPTVPGPVAPHDTLHELRERWLAACLAFDEQRSEQVLTQAFALFPVETVCLELLQPALAAIGQGWYRGEVSVQQEHFASALAIRRLEALLAATPPPVRSGRILVGCPPDEAHTFIPLLLSLFLRRRGWDVIYLGADIPEARLEETLKSARPTLTILTAQQLCTAASLATMAQLLYHQRIPLAFGGLIFNRLPALASRIAGHFLGQELRQALQAVEKLMEAPQPVAAHQPVTPEYAAALAHFQERRARIEAALWEAPRLKTLGRTLLLQGNESFGRDIEAALTLGDIRYLKPNLEWLQGLWHAHIQMPLSLLQEYLRAYLEAAQRHLDEPGQPILSWLHEVVAAFETEQTQEE